MEIEHISVSRSKTYSTCQQQYKYRYHLKVPSPVEEPFYFVYGKIVHKIAEVYVQERGQRSLGEISSDVLNGRIEIEPDRKAPPLLPDYKRRLPGHLRSIQVLTERIGTEGLLEYKFHYDLDPPNQKMAIGFIDRLILKNDGAYIIDYKTTKKGPFRVSKQDIVHDLQLRCYARVVWKDFGIHPSKIKAALYYLEGGDLVPTGFTEQSVLRAEEELLQAYNSISKSNPDNVRGKVGRHCNNCVYATICPFYGATGGRASTWDGDMSTI